MERTSKSAPSTISWTVNARPASASWNVRGTTSVCGSDPSWLAVHAVHALFLLATAAATVLACQLWLSTAPAGSGSEPLARHHFLAGLATLMVVAALVVLQYVEDLLVRVRERWSSPPT